MAVNIENLLGEAYRLARMKSNRAAAVALVKKAISEEPVIVPFLRDRNAQFKAVIAHRGEHADSIAVEVALSQVLDQALRS
jgi:hypothetical protein